ncbi:hypothetical protein H696_05801 [Fonticula alba]|uniref:Fe2OG dioxygenase domain-containing protein n=1 Tax=Fonticula alba TaxID=691883 RepID=A0A058Z0M5_FONAL|nr:hypothetical protein H696_05801 [Fonticula alba]KCV67691.1 hypothetical protein H696_05801 [Fonticula alba]|eukprot:XP_009497875.1 hypothetical protein H696_05801 [Fonticula alba]
MPSTPASRKRPAAGGRPLVEDTPLWGALPVEGSTHAAPRTDTAFRQAERRLKQAPRAELLDPGLARTRHGVHDPHNSDDLAAIMRRAPGCFVAAGALSIADQARLAQCAVVSWTGGRTNFSSLTLGSLKALTEVDLLAESPAPVARAAMISNAEACMERSCSRHHCAAALSQRHGALVKNPPAAKAPESDPRAAALKLVDRITTAEGAAAGCPPRRSHPWREFALAGGFPRKRGVPAPPLRKLRWATLGWHYNWTNKTYVEGDHGPMPELLASLARGAISQSPMAEEEGRKWVPEAAIVNYYSPGDSLTGHADFSEQAPEQAPLVSISLGCSAIFLIGGTCRSVDPVPVLLRSGDVVILSGPSRLAFHGVPRILEETTPPALLTYLAARGEDLFAEVGPGGQHKCPLLPSPPAEGEDFPSATTEGQLLAEYMRQSRLNFSVRQVFAAASPK